MEGKAKRVVHFSGLNGLRAIAALAVLFSHTTDGLTQFSLDPHILGIYPEGTSQISPFAGYAVTMFFALSGFLITYLLLEELRVKGAINIRNFYIRRILRIWPLYYLYLALSIATIYLFGESIEFRALPFYLLLFANVPFVFGIAIKFVGHYWSLGVEEQFYSFWPWIVKKSRSLLRVTVLICISLILLKWVLSHFDIRLHERSVNWPFEMMYNTRFQCMLIGAIGAILYFRKNALLLKITNNYAAQAAAWSVIALIAANHYHVSEFIDHEFISVVTVVLIIGQIRKTKRIINLDLPVFDFVGKISFGIYVFHPLVIFYLSKVLIFHDGRGSNYFLVYFLSLALTLVVAHLSYFYFEKRFLSLKGKYSAVKSSASIR